MNIKNIYKVLILCFFTFIFTPACNYLDVDQYFTDMLTMEKAFQKKQYVELRLQNIYTYFSHPEMGTKGSTAFAFASDEALFSDWSSGLLCQMYQNGDYGPSNNLQEDIWSNMYQGINQATTFIANVDKCTELRLNVIEDYRAQARFCRAYFYWMLLKQYGPIPLLGEKPINISQTYQELEVARNTYDECADFIANEFMECARILPPARQLSTFYQPTMGAALAARAKVLLYAASPLFNGNTDYASFKNAEGVNFISQVYSEEKWAKAAAAAKEVIDLGIYELNICLADTNTVKLAPNVPTDDYPNGAGGIDPFESYRQTFNGAVLPNNNRELIFTRPSNTINDMIIHSWPKTLIGWNCNAMSLKQLDAYYMFDGKDINDPAAIHPYTETGFTTVGSKIPFLRSEVNMSYAWREPRFYASVAFNGCVWPNLSSTQPNMTNKQIFYYKGSLDGKSAADIEHYVLTGVQFWKFLNPMDAHPSLGGSFMIKVSTDIRYADVLLWYAEALNNLTSTYSFKSYDNQRDVVVSRDINQMRSAFSRVRFRAGLPDLEQVTYESKNEFLTALKRERQIELFIEGARYFDLRRWKDAPIEEAKPFFGYNVDVSADQRQDFYKRSPLWLKKQFMKKMYLWPLPQSDLKMNSKLIQNPGWN